MKLCLICNFQTAGEQDICPRDGSSMVTVGDDPLLGMVVEGRYKIQSVIGQGSAGTVYRAVQELIGREVAVKVLHDYLVSDDEFIKRFKQEAKASSRLNHPNIITIYDFGVIPQGGGRPYIAMDLLNGTPLSDVITEVNHIDPIDAVPIFTQVCGAFGEAHRQGVVHRDIKPENIVLVERGGVKNFPIVVDFGIARLIQDESEQAKITRTGTVCGSPTYMSPEQCTSSKVDHRSDIYSLGIVIYETLTGEVPFQHEELVRVMAMHLSDSAKPINEVRPDLHFSDALINIVQKTLLKNPNDRFQSMEELSDALEESLKEPEAKPQHITQTVHKDLAPGPLAQDDALQHRKESREMIPARPQSTRDLAVNALEEQTRSAGANFQEQVQAYRDSQKNADHTVAKPVSAASFNAGRQKGGGGLAGTMRVLVPVVIAVVLLGAAVVFAMKQPQFSSLLGAAKGTDHAEPKSEDPDKLFRAGRYSQAREVWKPLKAKGALTSDQTDKYYSCCVNVARQYIKDKKFSEAIPLLKEVPSKASAYHDAKDLMKKAKRGR
jgi:serine/threonine protein kinase